MNDRQFEIEEYDRRQAQAFYAEAFPCETCGRPAGERFFSFEHQLWIGQDCPCILQAQLPVDFRCLEEYRLVVTGQSVRQISERVKFHRLTCSVCTPELESPLRKAA